MRSSSSPSIVILVVPYFTHRKNRRRDEVEQSQPPLHLASACLSYCCLFFETTTSPQDHLPFTQHRNTLSIVHNQHQEPASINIPPTLLLSLFFRLYQKFNQRCSTFKAAVSTSTLQDGSSLVPSLMDRRAVNIGMVCIMF